jgi:hypothetical protein
LGWQAGIDDAPLSSLSPSSSSSFSYSSPPPPPPRPLPPSLPSSSPFSFYTLLPLAGHNSELITEATIFFRQVVLIGRGLAHRKTRTYTGHINTENRRYTFRTAEDSGYYKLAATAIGPGFKRRKSILLTKQEWKNVLQLRDTYSNVIFACMHILLCLMFICCVYKFINTYQIYDSSPNRSAENELHKS